MDRRGLPARDDYVSERTEADSSHDKKGKPSGETNGEPEVQAPASARHHLTGKGPGPCRITETGDAGTEERYRDLFEHAPVGYVVTDAEGIIRETNRLASAMLHEPASQLEGKSLAEFIAARDREKFAGLIKCAQTSDQDYMQQAELHLKSPLSAPMPVLVILGPRPGAAALLPELRWLLHDHTEWEQAEKSQRERQAQLVDCQEQERRTISRVLHDQLGQHIAAILLGLKSVRNFEADDSPAQQKLRELQHIAEEIGREVQHISWELRPAALDDLGLCAAARNYVQDWSERSNLTVDFQCNCKDPHHRRMPAHIETTIYRIIQESITNVIKNAHATSASVMLERQADHVRVIVEDDGQGFDVEKLYREDVRLRLGLTGLQERVALVGGTMQIESAPGKGTAVFARIPLSADGREGYDV